MIARPGHALVSATRRRSSGSRAPDCAGVARGVASNPVTAHRRVLVLTALVAAFAMDAVAGAALRTATSLRADVCCARNCGPIRGVVCKTGCCPTARSLDENGWSPAAVSSTTVPVVAVACVDGAASVAPESKSGRPTIVRAGIDPPPEPRPNTPLRL